MEMAIFYPKYVKAIFASVLLTTPISASNFDPNNLTPSSSTLSASVPIPASLSEQSQQFWQAQQQPVDNPVPSHSFGFSRKMRTGYAMNSYQREEMEIASRRHAFSQMLREELPIGLQEKRQMMLRSLEEKASEGSKRALPSVVCQRLPAALINSCDFQVSDTFEQSSKKITGLGVKIISTPFPKTQVEKNNLIAICFLAAAYKALKMEGEVQEPYQCDFYVSVSELFVWAAHRYQSDQAKQYVLERASSNLKKAFRSLSFLTDSDLKKDWEMKISQLEGDIKERYGNLIPVGNEDILLTSK
jgi:hypothetical protein